MNLPKTISHETLTIFCLLLLFAGLFFSKFLLSVSMIGLAAIGLLRRDILTLLKDVGKHKAFWVLTGVFLILLLGGIHSSNMDYYMERMRIKLPFILLPLAFIGLPKLSSRQLNGLFYFFFLVLSLTSIGVLINYFYNFDALNEDIRIGQAITTPINHIRYSLLTAIGILLGIRLWVTGYSFQYLRERLLIKVLTVFLIVFIHVLSVRSGLLALYAACVILLVYYLLVNRKIMFGLLGLAGVVLLPFAAYQLVPSFHTKVNLTFHNLDMYKRGKIEDYSDTQRLVSYDMALKAANQSPVFGLGTGDVRDVVEAAYAEYRPKLPKRKLPHNQFLFVLVSVGWLGLLGFTVCFFGPLFLNKGYNDWLLLSVYAVVFCSFLVEATLETAIGTAFSLVFVLMLLKWRETD